MVNSQLIKDRAKNKKVSQKCLAEKIGIKQSSLSLKINNLRPMLLDEAGVIARVLEIEDADFNTYFFT